MATRVEAVGAVRSRSRSRRRWAGRILSGLAVLFLAMDAGGKLIAPTAMIANSPPMGIPADPDFYRLLGGILAVATALYAWARTAALGAVLLTGYLGGAIATHLSFGSPLLTHTLFGLYLGVIVWLGLGLRDDRVAAFASLGSAR